MRIKDALKDSYDYITELESKLAAVTEEKIYAAPEVKDEKSEAKPYATSRNMPDFQDAIIAAEKNISLNDLINLFKSTPLSVKATAKSLQPFVDYLKNRWLRIKEFYSLHYNTRYNDTLTIACYKLAADLAATGFYTKIRTELVREEKDEKKTEEKTFDKIKSIKITEPAHRYDLLIPSIITRNEIFSNEPDEDFSLDGEPLELRHFILDTPGYRHRLPTKPLALSSIKQDTYIVNVKTCMDYVSKNDRTLVHSSRMIGGKQFPLSNTLSDRVIYHSSETLNLWNNIALLVRIEKESNSVGGAIQRLIDALKSGSVVGRGTDEKASREAIEGIIDFQTYLIDNVGVDSDNYKILMNLHYKHGHLYTFKSLWYKLIWGSAGTHKNLQFSEERIQEIISHLNPHAADLDPHEAPGYSCVNVISGDFRDILKKHYEKLYGMTYDLLLKKRLVNLNSELLNNQTLIIEGLRGNTLHPVVLDEIPFLSPTVKMSLGAKDLNSSKIKLLIQDHLFLFKLLCLLNKDHRITLCYNHLTTLYVVNTVANLNNLLSGLHIINKTCEPEHAALLQWEIILAIGNDFLFKYLNSAKKLLKISAELSPHNFFILIRDKLHVGEGMANARRDPDNFLKELSPETLAMVGHLFASKSLAQKTLSLISATTSAFFKRKASDSKEDAKKPDKRHRTQSGSQSSASDADEFAATQVEETFMTAESSFQPRR